MFRIGVVYKLLLVVSLCCLASMIPGGRAVLQEKHVNKEWVVAETQGFHPPPFSAALKYQRPGKIGIAFGQQEAIAVRNGLVGGVLTEEIKENILYNFVFELDLATVTWSLLHDGSGTAPDFRAFPAGGYHAGTDSLYAFGGVAISADFVVPTFAQSFKNDLWRLNFTSNTWTQLSPTGTPPSPRASMGFGIIDDALYVFSGNWLVEGEIISDNALYKYNILTNHWSTLFSDDPFDFTRPENRSQPGCQVQPGKDRLFIVGGDTFVIDPSTPSGIRTVTQRDVWYYDVGDDDWTELESEADFPTPSPSQFGMAFRTQNVFYIQNGDRQGNQSVLDTCNAAPLVGYLAPGFPNCYLPNTPSSDTFEYNTQKEEWSEIILKGSPPKTRRSELWFDDESGSFFLAGGYGWDGNHSYKRLRLINGNMTVEEVAPAEIQQPLTYRID